MIFPMNCTVRGTHETKPGQDWRNESPVILDDLASPSRSSPVGGDIGKTTTGPQALPDKSITGDDSLDVISGMRRLWSTRPRIDHLFAVAVVLGCDHGTTLLANRVDRTDGDLEICILKKTSS